MALIVLEITSVIRVPDSDYIYISARIDDGTPENKLHLLIAKIDAANNDIRVVPAPDSLEEGYLVQRTHIVDEEVVPLETAFYLGTSNNLPIVVNGDYLLITRPN
jgi:hypothetical protein